LSVTVLITGCPEAGSNMGGTHTLAQQRRGVTEEKYMVLYDFKAQVNKYLFLVSYPGDTNLFKYLLLLVMLRV